MGVMVPCQDILARAKVEGADIVGLSGLITPSLEEMQHVAAEMQRDEYFRMKKIPLLIGGATTSRVHTAVKIAPHYEGPVVYVPDASRSVGVCSDLLSDERAAALHRRAEAPTTTACASSTPSKKATPLVTLAQARANKTPIDWAAYDAAGAEVHRPARVPQLRPGRARRSCIDWGPFFQTWDLAGPYPQILDRRGRRRVGPPRFSDGQRMLQAADRRPLAHRQRRDRPVPGRTRSTTTTSRSMPTSRAAGADDLARPAHADRAPGGRRRAAPEPLPGRLHRAQGREARLHRPVRRDGRPRRRQEGEAVPRRPRRLLARSCSRRSPTAWPRPSPSGCTSACAPSCGATRPTRR